MKKKFASIILVVALALTLVPTVSANSEDVIKNHIITVDDVYTNTKTDIYVSTKWCITQS